MSTTTYETITHYFIHGKWEAASTFTGDDGSENYVIKFGNLDWSNFRHLDECLMQDPDPSRKRPPCTYTIVRR